MPAGAAPTQAHGVRVRAALASDSALLPDVERSAAERFRTLPDRAWIANDPPWPTAWHRRRIAAGFVLVAEIVDYVGDGELAGLVSAEPAGPDLHVQEMAVRFEQQGRGIGRRLLAALVERAQAAGFRGVTLTTFADVPWNGPFYASLGFRTVPELGDTRLAAILADERERGLVEGRCAMRLVLAG